MKYQPSLINTNVEFTLTKNDLLHGRTNTAFVTVFIPIAGMKIASVPTRDDGTPVNGLLVDFPRDLLDCMVGAGIAIAGPCVGVISESKYTQNGVEKSSLDIKATPVAAADLSEAQIMAMLAARAERIAAANAAPADDEARG